MQRKSPKEFINLTRRQSLQLLCATAAVLPGAGLLLEGFASAASPVPEVSGRQSLIASQNSDAGPTTFTYQTALAPQAGVTRRDPSDVIFHDGLYYVWYTKVLKGPHTTSNAGYGGDIWYATSSDGRHFVERGRALGRGGKHEWDEHGVFTPNILVWRKRYYLYYTAVASPYDDQTPTAFGVAIADSPAGPWKKFGGNPVLRPDAANPKAFDSMRVDDAALVVRGSKILLYYKGRCILDGVRGWTMTHMGVAIAANPTGPFVKSSANPLLRGHEVLVWPWGHGVGSMVTNMGPRQIYFAPDDLHFKPHNPIVGGPAAPGIYRADNFAPNADGQLPQWGISMGYKDHVVYLQRFECHYHNRRRPPARK